MNEKGGFNKAGPDAYLNTTHDRYRMRIRARLGMDAKVTNDVKAAFRVSTGNTNDPVSTNQTMGNYGNRYGVMWDQAYIRADEIDLNDFRYLTLLGGRMPNPWFSTDLVWDSDLAFEGVAATYRHNLNGSDSLMDMTQHDRTLFFTLGAFPLQEVELSAKDKWLYGAQLGSEFIFQNQSELKFGVSYYYYRNITGRRNAVDSTLLDYTAPGFMQKGNLLFDIRNDSDTTTDLWALASDYKELNVTAALDLAMLSPIHIIVTADYVKNMGYDKDKILTRSGGQVARSGGVDTNNPLRARTMGYQVQLTIGWPDVTLPGNWRTQFAYKYLQADAVLDAFTDSDFHLGGTDAKGWIFGLDYGVGENTWMTLRYITADAIDGIPFGVDVIQLDINAKF